MAATGARRQQGATAPPPEVGATDGWTAMHRPPVGPESEPGAYATWTRVLAVQKVFPAAAPGALTTWPSQTPYELPKMVLPVIVTVIGLAAD